MYEDEARATARVRRGPKIMLILYIEASEHGDRLGWGQGTKALGLLVRTADRYIGTGAGALRFDTQRKGQPRICLLLLQLEGDLNILCATV
jgi:hypothetical protein